MINESLSFLAVEVNKYLNIRFPFDGADSQPRLVVGNIALAAESASSATPSVKNKAVISLINVEEDRVAKIQENAIKTATTTIYKNPPVLINLYILFSINRDSYTDTLNLLSGIILFFQHQNVFTPSTHPSLDSRIQKLTVDLHSQGFEQMNHMWSILGGKYIPSVMYKVKQLLMQEDVVTGESGLIRDIVFKDKIKSPFN